LLRNAAASPISTALIHEELQHPAGRAQAKLTNKFQ